MLSLQFVRENKDLVKTTAANKGVSVDIDKLLSLDEKHRQKLQEVESLRAERNALASEMKSRKPTPEEIEKGRNLKEKIAAMEPEAEALETEVAELLYHVPNIASDDTPIGSSEDDNKILRQVGDKPGFDFQPKPHWEMLNFIDQQRAARISGARFAFIQGGMAQLQMALMNWGMSVLTDEKILAEIAQKYGLDVSTKAFQPMLPPVMLRTDSYKSTGRLKPDDVTFKLANDDLWLIGSAEHSLCAYYSGEVLDEEDLPIRFVGYSPAFRREVGSAGKDTRGIIRVHQFNKLEMESFVLPEASRVEHEFMIAIQEYLTAQLGLSYQVVLKCTADMGGPNIRGVDIETWMPGQACYRETHSADYIGDFQARGLNTKLKRLDGRKELVHTNDATALADRTLIAIMEQYQQQDGSVKVPEVLQKYIGKEYLR
jgi:seryl-tRNA synthetase